ncbi:hypothetical protein QA601_04245 [Chitinispirillales bacterium ANBcel5]|uniref:hypothetical protein n=1 Tax=Cellulosispirillum alkaliphilum TaxID=3039283 RepID=UPI002A5801C5|nr:hypothetical protein [Chitinispirillales bacterium ANBcel5]
MKNVGVKSVYLLIFLVINMLSTCYATSVKNFTYYPSSPTVFYDPSKISLQKGIPTILEIEYISENEWNLRGALSKSFENKGYSVGYEYLKDVGTHRIISGFNHKENNFLIGSAFSIYYDLNGNTSLALDLALATILNEYSISLIYKNVYVYEPFLETNPSLFLRFTGPINFLNQSLFIESGPFLKNVDNFSNPGLYLCLSYLSMNFPLSVSSGFYLVRNSRSEYSTEFSITASFYLDYRNLVTGIRTGYVVSEKDRYVGSFYVNPTKNKDRKAPLIDIEVRRDSVAGFYFGLSASDKGGSGVKNWVLAISERPSVRAQAVRMFSGGSIPPSVVYWDGKDSTGTFRANETLYARFVVTDNSNNIAATEWLKVR